VPAALRDHLAEHRRPEAEDAVPRLLLRRTAPPRTPDLPIPARHQEEDQVPTKPQLATARTHLPFVTGGNSRGRLQHAVGLRHQTLHSERDAQQVLDLRGGCWQVAQPDVLH